MLIMKFGGSSLGTRAGLLAARDQIVMTASDEKTVVVVSAIGRTTDVLIEADQDLAAAVDDLLEIHAHALEQVSASSRQRIRAWIEDLPNWACDRSAPEIHSAGEVIATEIVTDLLARADCPVRNLGLHHVVVGSGDRPIVDLESTAQRFAAAGFAPDCPAICVVGGFGGMRADGRIELLGRGGSDTVATSLGAALGARVVELWKDVDGVHRCDPHAGAPTPVIARMHWSEANELAHTGARILHERSIEPAWRTRIPVHVRHTGFPDEPGTWIADAAPPTRSRRHVA